MRVLIIVDKGLEDAACLEVKRLDSLLKPKQIADQLVSVEATSKQTALLVYKMQTAIRILSLLHESSVDKQDPTKVDLSEWITGNETIKVAASGFDDPIAVSRTYGTHLASTYNLKADMKNPSLRVVVYSMQDTVYVGIDLSQTNLSKREYRVFTHNASLKATVAAGLCYLAKITPKMVVLDPFCGGGTISIEAACILSGKSPRFYEKHIFGFLSLKPFGDIELDQFDTDAEITGRIQGYDCEFKYVDSAKKNAKIAGVNKKLYLSRVEADWLDLKTEKKSVDRVISYPPLFSKYDDKKTIAAYDEFFDRITPLLSPKGQILFLTNDADKLEDLIPEEFDFTVRDVSIGKTDVSLFTLTLSKK
ncbi:MAG: 23S rRNA G2445 N2-methylase RlmL [Candidatus Woesearchaeota archaeon]|jgi:23S rRNA G2445 N2-methylase RlmL